MIKHSRNDDEPTVHGSNKDKENEIHQAYCVKCRSKKQIKNPKTETLKNNKKAIVGVCSECGTKMVRLGGLKATI